MLSPCASLRERRVGRGHCIVDEQCERNDQRAERDPLHVDAGQLHEGEDDGERQRNGERNHQAGANAEADETHHENDRHGLPQRCHEVGDGVLDRDRLIGDQDGLNSHRQSGGDLRHGLGDAVAERENVAALAHGDGEADRRLAIHPELRLGRIDEAAVNARDIAEAKHTPADGEVHACYVLFGLERTRNSHRHGFIAGLNHAGGSNDILRL